MEPSFIPQDFTQIIGTSGRDILSGSEENSQFFGGPGRDVLIGGSGIDQFVYTALIDGPDTIQNFELDRDQIVLTDLLSDINYLGMDAFTDGIVQVQPFRGSSVVLIDPDGTLGNARARSFLLVQDIKADDLLSNPNNFVLTPDVVNVTVSAELSDDTGTSATDGVTFDASISGSVDQPLLVQQLLANFNGGNPVDVTDQLQPDGTFTLSPDVLADINGGRLSDGIYTLELQAISTDGQPSDVFSLTFQLDTTAPIITLGLAPSTDSAPIGDQQTTFESINLLGQTEAGLTVNLVTPDDSTQADATGEFTFEEIDLAVGSTVFSASASDLAGNQASAITVVERILQPNQPPTVDPDKTILVDEDSTAVALDISSPSDADGDVLGVTVDAIPEGGKGFIQLADGTPVALGQALSVEELQGLQFVPVLDANGDAGVFRYTVDDGQGGVATQTITLAISPINDAPVLTVPGPQTTPENTDLFISGISLSDVDLEGGDVEVALVVANGNLTLGQTPGLSFTAGDGTDDATLVFTSSLDAVNNALATLSYRSEANFNGVDTLSLTVSDLGNSGEGGPLTDRQVIDITVSATNVPPVVDPDKTLTVDEDSGATSLSIAAPSDADGDVLTITVSAIPDGTQGIVQLADGTPITVGQPLSIADLQSLQFVPQANANGDAGSFSYTVTDGQGGSATQAISLSINPVNDAPTVSVPGAQSTPNNADLAIVGISVSDIDVDAGDLELTISVNQGNLSLGQTTGLTFSTGDGLEDSMLIFTGTVAAVNAALATLTYRSNAGFAGDDTLTVGVSDLGNTGTGGPLEDSASIAIAVTPSDPLTGEIRGVKWEDLDADGVLDGIETGMEGVSIYLDLNQNGQLDANEPTQITGETGTYSFTGLAAGNYQVREVLSAGYAQTYPLARPIDAGDGYADVILEYFAAGNSPSPLPEPYGSNGGPPTPTADNGFFTIEAVDPEVILGAPPTGPILSSNPDVDWLALPQDSYVTVGFLDERIVDGPGDDILIRSFDPADSANEFADVFVSADGLNFEFLGTVNEAGATTLDLADIGFIQPVVAARIVGLDNLGTSPGFNLISVEALAGSRTSPDFHTVDLAAGEVVENIDFGNKLPTGEIRGRKWEDSNGNGLQDSGENGLADTTIYLDLDGDNRFDPDEPNQQTDANGQYRFRDLVAGTYSVQEVLPIDFVATFPTNGGYQFDLGVGEIVDDIDFGNQQLTQPIIENRAPEFTSTPITSGTEGAEYSYQPLATDPDGDTLTFSLLDAPNGLTIESATGLLIWNPEANQVGEAPVTIQVSDDDGLTDTQSFAIDVQGRIVNNAPIFISDPVTDFAIAVPNTATGDVSPELLSLDLDNGETATETVSITLPTGGVSTGGQADIVFVVDESGSMNTEHEWLTDMVLELDNALQARGITDNRYSLIGYTNQTRLFNLAAQTQVSVYGPGNQLIGSGSFDALISNPQLEFDLGADGTYTVVISPLGTSVPLEYTLEGTVVDGADIAPANLNTTFSGIIDPQAQQTYTFEAPAGTAILFDGLGAASSSIRASLQDPDGETIFVGARFDRDSGPYVLTDSGTHTVVVDGGTVGGNFSFQIIDLDAAATAIDLGTEITGTIATAFGTEIFQFTATGGQQVYFDGITGSFVTGAIYGPEGQTLGSGINLRDFTTIIPTDGTYTLALQSGTASATNYSFKVVTAEIQQNTVAIGDAISGSLDEVGEKDVYQFSGTAGQRLWLDGLGADSFSVGASLVSPTGRTLINNARLGQDSGPVTLLTSGLYSLVVSGDGQLGNYGFQLQDFADATNVDGEIAAGTPITTTFDNGIETQFFSFTGTVGQQLLLDGTSGSISGTWLLYGADNRLIAQAAMTSDLTATLPTDGTYTLVLDGNSSNPFEYTFQIAEQVIERTAIAFGDTVAGILTTGGEQDVYTFTGTAGQRLLFDGLTSASFLIDTTLTSPTGQTLFNRLDVNGDSAILVLPEAGEYSLVINGNNIVGDYSFRVLNLDDASPLFLGTPVSNTLSPGTQTEIYTFNGTAGQALAFDMVAVDSIFSGSWALYGPTSSTAIASNNRLDDFNATLPTDGTYTLVVDGNSANPLNYSFNVADVSTSVGITPSDFGITQSGTLTATNQEDIYTFDVAAGTGIVVDGLESSSSNVRMKLVAPDGSQIFSNVPLSNNPLRTLPVEGTYSLIVSTLGSLGDYRFRILNLDEAETFPIDTILNGTLEEGGGIELYQFAGMAGQKLYFNGKSATGSGEWQLWGSDNTLIGSNTLTRDFIATLPNDDIYTILIGGSTANSSPIDFSVEVVTPEQQVSALTLGDTVTGSLMEAGEQDIYRFSAAAGQQLLFDGLGSDNFSITARLIGPTGTQVLSNIRSDRDSSAFVLSDSGDYSLIISGNDQTGDYSFRLLDLNAEGTVIGFDAEISDTITLGLATEVYEFTGSTGQALFFNALNSSGSLTSTLLGPNNANLGSNFFSNDFSAVLPTNGTYKLLLASGTSNSVDFSFEVVTPPATPPQTIDYDETIAGELGEPGETDIYQFTGVAGQQIWFDGLQSDSINIEVALLSPTGEIIFSRQDLDSDSATPYTLSESGAFSLVINSDRGNPGSTTGNYSFQILDILPNLTLPNEISGTFNLTNESQVFQFEGQSGQQFILSANEGIFGTAAQLSNATEQLSISQGGTEDGYLGIDTALQLPFRPGAATNIILVTDEDRDNAGNELTRESTLAALIDQNALLNVTVDGTFLDGNGATALGVDSAGTAYIADGNGGFITSSGGEFNQAGGLAFTVEEDYVTLAWDSLGAAWDLNQLREGGDTAVSFTQAFVNVKAQEIGDQFSIDLIASDPNIDFANLTGPLFGVNPGQTASFETTITGDGLARNFELFFVRPETGFVLGSIPVSINQDYLYLAQAIDPDGDDLTYSLVSAPADATINATTGRIDWTPPTTGFYQFEIAVDDGRGGQTVQSYEVEVYAAGGDNTAPTITSTAPIVARVGSPLSYSVTAEDAEGDSLTYFLAAAPDGVAIASDTGLLTWTPTESQAGDQTITVQVVDGQGGSDTQSFVLTVAANQRPIFTSDPFLGGSPDQLYEYDVDATDPEGTVITYSLRSDAPAGMTIDATTGLIQWTPTSEQTGQLPITVLATDAEGERSFQSFLLNVNAPGSGSGGTGGGGAGSGGTGGSTGENPVVFLGFNSNLVDVGEDLNLQVRAVDNESIASVVLEVDGQIVNLNPGSLENGAINEAVVQFTQAGLVDIVATATDNDGNVATQSLSVRVVDPNDTTAPFVEIDTSQFVNGDTTLESLTDIFGTVQDDNLEFYRLEIAPIAGADINNPTVNDPDYIVLTQGDSNVDSGLLGAVDPRKFGTGSYFLRAIAGDFSGNINIQGIPVTLTSAEKSGQFRIEINDLTVPLAGLPIEINRVYDSLESRESSDFGFGWSLGVQDAQIEESVPVTDGVPGVPSIFSATPFKVGDTVTLTNPDGERVSFIFDPVVAGGSLLGTFWEPKFTPTPGVFDRLEVDNILLSQRSDGTFGLAFIPFPYNPSEYKLTTRDGTTYNYDQFDGLTSIEDTRGNTLTYTDDGIFSSTGASILFTRDSDGRITEITDPNGNAITYTYDANGNLITATDQENLTVTHDYFDDGSNLLDTITDPQGRIITRTEFDNFGRITKTTDALGNVSTRTYTDNPDGTITEVFTNPEGQTLTTVRDAQGNVVSSTDAVGATTTTVYDDNNNPIQVTDARGNTTTRVFDDRGNLLSVTDADGNTRNFTYDDQNNLLTDTDELGRATEFIYDAQGNLLEIIDAAGESVTFDYDAFGRVERFTDANGNFSLYDYAAASGSGAGALALSKPTKVTFADGSTQEFSYNAFGQITRVVDENGQETEYITDNAGRLITLRDPLGNETNYTYDAQYITQVTNALGETAQFEYDDNGRLIRQIDPEGGITEFEYDSLGREVRETVYLSTTDPTQQRTTLTTYRADGFIESITDGAGNITRFEYDLVGNQTAVIDPLGQRTEFVYDDLNRQTQKIDPLGNVTTYNYDDVGNIVTIVDGNGRRRTFSYDELDRLDIETWLEGSNPIRTIDYDYDAVGNLTGVLDPDSSLAFFYNNRDRLAQVDYSGTPGLDGVTLTYTYDGAGNVLSVIDNFGTEVTSTYDPRNLLTQRGWQGGGVDPIRTEFTYNAAGDLTAVTRYADLTGTQKIGSSSYTYDAAQRLTGITHRDGNEQVLADYAYALNTAGELIQETRNGETFDYSYDSAAQLVEVDHSGSADESYDYDANGNRESSSVHGNAYVTGDNNRLESDGVYNYDYDNEGNLIRRIEIATGEVREFTWDYRNRLVGITDEADDGSTIQEITYTYDAFDRRLSETVDGETTYFVSDGETLWAELNEANEVIARYLPGAEIDEVLARYRAEDGTAWHLTDRLNTVRGLVDAVGSLINEIEYDSFGRKLSETNPDAGDRFGFTGREYDENTGLYYYRARYYDPAVGRFISQDPIGFGGEDANLYRYVGNNATNATDPTGLIAAIQYGGLIKTQVLGVGGTVPGAIIGGLQGFGVTNLIFLGNILEISNRGGDVIAEWGTAISKTADQLEDIEAQLKRFGAVDTKEGLVKGFVDGAGVDIFNISIGGTAGKVLTATGLESPIKPIEDKVNISLRRGGFTEGYTKGLEYLRALNPN